jgi:hypothetical protein
LLNQTGFGKPGVNWPVFPALTSVMTFVVVLLVAILGMLVSVLSVPLAHAHAFMRVMWLNLLVFFGRLEEGQRSCISNMNRCKKEKSCADKTHHLLS